MPKRNRSSAQAIEQVVRAELLLLALLLFLAAALLVQRGGWLAWIGIGAVSAILALLSRALASASMRELLRTAQYGLLAACVLVLLAIGLGPKLGLYRTMTVLSGSMRPTFSPGDVIVVRPVPLRDVRVGQVISYHIPIGDHHVQTHRVIAIVHGGAHPSVRTKGDANAAPDPWVAKLHGTTAWRVRAVLPKLGWVVFWFRTPLMHKLSVFLAPILLALLGLLRIWRGGESETAAEGPDELARTLAT